jgi:hypothetical protein
MQAATNAELGLFRIKEREQVIDLEDLLIERGVDERAFVDRTVNDSAGNSYADRIGSSTLDLEVAEVEPMAPVETIEPVDPGRDIPFFDPQVFIEADNDAGRSRRAAQDGLCVDVIEKKRADVYLESIRQVPFRRERLGGRWD